MGVLNTDLGKQLQAQRLGARLWRLRSRPGLDKASPSNPGGACTCCSEGTGRLRVDDELLTLDPMSAVAIESGTIRQLFNDTDDDQLWLVVGAPPEVANTLRMSDDDLAWLYPDGPKALPPELEG